MIPPEPMIEPMIEPMFEHRVGCPRPDVGFVRECVDDEVRLLAVCAGCDVVVVVLGPAR